MRGEFLLFDGSGFGENVTIFSADMSLLVHIDNNKKIKRNIHSR